MIHEGQKLWMVHGDSRRSSSQEVTVTKIGRKWATIDFLRYRIDVDTLIIDGGKHQSPGRCYVDRVAYEAERDTRNEWTDLVRRLTYSSPPAGMTVERINELRQEFGLNSRGSGEE